MRKLDSEVDGGGSMTDTQLLYFASFRNMSFNTAGYLRHLEENNARCFLSQRGESLCVLKDASPLRYSSLVNFALSLDIFSPLAFIPYGIRLLRRRLFPSLN